VILFHVGIGGVICIVAIVISIALPDEHLRLYLSFFSFFHQVGRTQSQSFFLFVVKLRTVDCVVGYDLGGSNVGRPTMGWPTYYGAQQDLADSPFP